MCGNLQKQLRHAGFADPPTLQEQYARLLFCMVVDAANRSLFCWFCSQPVPSCCFANSSFMCWLHHLSMTPVVPSLHLYGTSNLSDFSQRWEGGAEIPQRWSFGPITAVSHPPPSQTAFLLFCISCWNATKRTYVNLSKHLQYTFAFLSFWRLLIIYSKKNKKHTWVARSSIFSQHE